MNEANTQIEEVRKRHLAFEALSPIEKQVLRWRDLKRDPKLQDKAKEIIGSLGGAKFNIETLQEKHQIYAGYFHQPALKNGYVAVLIADKHTGEYILKKDDVRTLKEVIKNQDWLLSQLEAENEKLKKKLATL